MGCGCAVCGERDWERGFRGFWIVDRSAGVEKMGSGRVRFRV